MSPAKKTGKKGFETEELVRSYFLAAGFYVIRGVQLRHGGDDLTDIDLWMYERSATLARRRIIIDIKDNAQPKAAERLFFVKGLAEIVQVEGTGIVTSDSRRTLRELARRHNVLWIDNADLQRLKSSQRLQGTTRISDQQLQAQIAQIDTARSSRMVRDTFHNIKSSVADRFGAASANTAIDGLQVFAKMAIEAHPKSGAAELLTRLAYFCAGLAAASLDYASGEFALRPSQERVAFLTEAIRFGADAKGTLEKLKWAEAAIRDFGPEESGTAEMVRSGFQAALQAVPAEDLAEVTARLASSDRLFISALELEQAAHSLVLPSFDQLSLDARSLLGALLDFAEVDRSRFSGAVAAAAQVGATEGESDVSGLTENETAPSFPGPKPAEGKLL